VPLLISCKALLAYRKTLNNILQNLRESCSNVTRGNGVCFYVFHLRQPIFVAGTRLSVCSIRSEPLRSRDFSVLVVPVSRHFGQAMKSRRNLICSLFNANVLKSTKGFIKKNYKQDPTVNQHEHMIFVIISMQIKSLSTFSIEYKYLKLIMTIQI